MQFGLVVAWRRVGVVAGMFGGFPSTVNSAECSGALELCVGTDPGPGPLDQDRPDGGPAPPGPAI